MNVTCFYAGSVMKDLIGFYFILTDKRLLLGL